MKKYLLLSLFILLALSLFSQENVAEEIINEETTEEDSDYKSKISVNGFSSDFIFSWKREIQGHWKGVGIDFSQLSGKDDVALNFGKSIGLSANMFQESYVFNPHWLVSVGIGFGYNQYRFKDDIALKQMDGKTTFVSPPEGATYKSSQFTYSFVNLALVFEYQTKLTKSTPFFVLGGIESIAPMYGSRSVVKEKSLTGTSKDEYRSFNLESKNSYRVVLKAGIDDIAVFGYYQFHSMFEKGKGPNLHPWGIGLMLPLVLTHK
jgi:hypothetical protein